MNTKWSKKISNLIKIINNENLNEAKEHYSKKHYEKAVIYLLTFSAKLFIKYQII